VAQKPLSGTYAANVARWGVGGLNIDGCRVDNPGPHGTEGRKKFDGFGDGDGFLGHLDSQKVPPHALGRWPANVALDEDAAAELDAQSGERKGDPSGRKPRTSTLAAWRRMEGRADLPVAPEGQGYCDSGGASRFFYCAKASKSDRGDGNTHPTVKPVALMRWLVRLVTPPGALVLDPFLGSGTTALAAVAEGARFVGIEREAEYLEIATRRLATLPVRSLFAGGG
jgi:hypothetical protein